MLNAELQFDMRLGEMEFEEVEEFVYLDVTANVKNRIDRGKTE